MTHSVTKSFLSSVVGVAYDHGMIKSIHDPVRDYVAPIQVYNPLPAANKSDRFNTPDLLALFETPHNREITWDDLLRQTSDWEGTLWGKPDWADRPGPNPAEWTRRVHNKPGTTYKYNDTRVNVLALAALNVWRRPLPQVLKENIMDPIGASNTWRWFGYENSWVVLDGSPMQSVTGVGTGAAACISMPTTWPASVTSRCVAASGKTASCSRINGSIRHAPRPSPSRSTDT